MIVCLVCLACLVYVYQRESYLEFLECPKLQENSTTKYVQSNKIDRRLKLSRLVFRQISFCTTFLDMVWGSVHTQFRIELNFTLLNLCVCWLLLLLLLNRTTLCLWGLS